MEFFFFTYHEYKDHILASHEEGRDFVKCPLERCQAPVRDAKLHIKVKHPTEKCPKTGQMRALIWKDQKPPSKRKKKTKFHEGYINSSKNNKQMHYRSGWERDVYICLENWSEVVGYKVESFPVEYYWRGKTKRYYPDLLINFKNGNSEVWEVKPHNQKQLEMNQAKWAACENHCQARGWKFKIIDENCIKQLKSQVKMEIGLMIDNAKSLEFPADFFEREENK